MNKIIWSISFFMMLALTSNNLMAQSKIKTDTLTVYGNCGQCKTRIEEATYLKGVKHAEWNKKTKILTVVYNPSKTSLDKITLAIAKAGHDTREHKSSDKDYNKLPACCAYRSGKCDHE